MNNFMLSSCDIFSGARAIMFKSLRNHKTVLLVTDAQKKIGLSPGSFIMVKSIAIDFVQTHREVNTFMEDVMGWSNSKSIE